MKWVIFNPDQFLLFFFFSSIRMWPPEQLGQHKQGKPGVCSAEWEARDTWLRSKCAVCGFAFALLGHPAVDRFGLCSCENVAPT